MMDLRKGFVDEVKGIIEDSRVKAIRSVDHVRVKMYWELGRKIVEEEQQGKGRAEYGKFLIKNLSVLLQSIYGSGYSRRQLEMFRKFYQTFPIAHAVRAQFTWRHYRIYISIENQHKRDFYQEECIKNTWSYRQLERQVNTLHLSFQAKQMSFRAKRETCSSILNNQVPRYARNDSVEERGKITARSLASLGMTKGFNSLNPFNFFN